MQILATYPFLNGQQPGIMAGLQMSYADFCICLCLQASQPGLAGCYTITTTIRGISNRPAGGGQMRPQFLYICCVNCCY